MIEKRGETEHTIIVIIAFGTQLPTLHNLRLPTMHATRATKATIRTYTTLDAHTTETASIPHDAGTTDTTDTTIAPTTPVATYNMSKANATIGIDAATCAAHANAPTILPVTIVGTAICKDTP